MSLFIGTSGWSERKGARLASQVSVAEISSSFHRPLERKTVERWLKLVQLTPEFQFTVQLGRQFTHERLMAGSAVAFFKEGLWPFVRERRMGALLMRFPEQFHFTVKNEEHLVQLRRAFHEFRLVAEFQHESWATSEARGVLIDRHIGVVGTHLTSGTGYLRIPARHWDLDSVEGDIKKITPLAEQTFVIFDDEISAGEMQTRLNGLTIAPVQPSFSFDRAVA